MKYPCVKLGDICEIRSGSTHHGIEDINGKYPVYGSGGLISRATNWRCPANTVIVGRKGTLDNPMLIREPFWNIDTCFGVICGENILPEYLLAFCQNIDFYSLVPSSGRPSTTSDSIRALKIPLPPLSVQQELVKQLEKDFERVKMMSEGFSRMAELADEEFKSVLSETFEQVEGKKVKLGDVCDCCLGKMLDKSKNKGKLHRYLRNVNVRWGAFDLEDVLEMRFEDDEHERYGLKNGDIVMCEGGEPGRCAIWREEEPGMLFQKALHRIRPSNVFLSEYLYFLFMSYSYNGIFRERFVGTTIYHLTGQVLKELPVTVCSIENQQLVISNLSLAETHKNSLKTESEHGLSLCSELRKSILQEAFS